MGIPDQIYEHPRATIAGGVLGFWIVYLAALTVYRLYVSPLARFPGPKLAAATIFPKFWHQASGDLVRWTHELHREYGTIVRVGPAELSFIDGRAFQDIYGFQSPGKPSNGKDPRFYDFASLETRSIINANDADHSRGRRVFSHAFSDKALKEQEPLLAKYIDLLGEKLQETVIADPDAEVNMVEMVNFTTFDIMGTILHPFWKHSTHRKTRRSYIWRTPLHAPELRVCTLG
jgi:cytochrome P450